MGIKKYGILIFFILFFSMGSFKVMSITTEYNSIGYNNGDYTNWGAYFYRDNTDAPPLGTAPGSLSYTLDVSGTSSIGADDSVYQAVTQGSGEYNYLYGFVDLDEVPGTISSVKYKGIAMGNVDDETCHRWWLYDFVSSTWDAQTSIECWGIGGSESLETVNKAYPNEFNGSDGKTYWLVQADNDSNILNVDFIQIEVTYTPNYPRFDPITNFTVNEDSSDFTLDFSGNISDVEDSDADLGISWIRSVSDGDAINISGIVNATDVATFHLQPNASGTHTFDLTVVDLDGFTNTTSFNITVNDVNDAPLWTETFSNASINEDSGDHTLDVTDLISDVEDADADLKLTAIKISGTTTTLISVNNATDLFTFGLDKNESGTDVWNLTVWDVGGLTKSVFYSITVNSINDNPWMQSVSGFNNFTVIEDASAFTAISDTEFTGNFSDVEDSEPSSIHSSILSQSDNSIVDCVLSGGGPINMEMICTPQSNQYGQNIITLNLSDSGGLSFLMNVNISVDSDNDAPSVASVNMTPGVPITTDDLVCVNGSLSDIEGDTVMSLYRWYNNSVLVDIPLNYSTLDAGNTSDGEQWYCGVIPYDFEDNGTEVFSPTRTIGSSNTAPIISTSLIVDGGTNVTVLNPVNNLTDSYINITAEILDPDADTFKMFACVTNDATINGCGAGGLFCNSTASASLNQSCIFNTTTNSSGQHTVYIYTYDGTDLSSYKINYYYINSKPTISEETINEEGVFNGTAISFTFKINDTNANEDVCWFNYTSGNAYEFSETVMGTIVGETCSFNYVPNATGDFFLYPYGNDTMNWSELGTAQQGVRLNYTDKFSVSLESYYNVGWDLNATRSWNVSNFGTKSVGSIDGEIDNVPYWDDKIANAFSIASLNVDTSTTTTLYLKRVPIEEYDSYSLVHPTVTSYNYSITLNCSYDGINGTEIRYLIPKTRLTSYDSATTTDAHVNGSSSGTSVDETTIGGVNYVRVTINTSNADVDSSIHEGLNPTSLYYSWVPEDDAGGGAGFFIETLPTNSSCTTDEECGSGYCDYTNYLESQETVCVRLGDMCGNNICQKDRGETGTSCPEDCGLRQRTLNLLEQKGLVGILIILGIAMSILIVTETMKQKNIKLDRDIKKLWKKAKSTNRRS